VYTVSRRGGGVPPYCPTMTRYYSPQANFISGWGEGEEKDVEKKTNMNKYIGLN
jgi:hypothetical protein